jgi:LacI family transcriptional regulator
MADRKIPKIIVLLDPSRGYERGLLRGIWHYSNLQGPWIFLRKAPYYQRFCGLRDNDLKRLGDCGADGIITSYRPEWKGILTLGLPIVVAPSLQTVPGMVNVVNDDATIGIMAATHLREMGLRHFAYAGFSQLPWSLARMHGFCDHMRKAGIDVQCHLAPFQANRRAVVRAEAALVQWLRDLPKPVGLMVCNDEFALSISELCRIHELHVPEQIAILGVDNDEVICELSNPPLSSIAIAAQQAGYEAARLLDQLMRGESSGRDVIAQASHVVSRQSTDMTAIDDPEVAKAMTFIHQNSHRIVQVNDVVKATSLSRRGLADRFNQSIGHSISDQIHRRRVEYIMNRLATTHQSIAQIADDIGYSSDKHIARYFYRQTGLTPRAYRQKHGSF